MIRRRCNDVHLIARVDELQYFKYHPEKEADVVRYCVKIMNRDYPDFGEVSGLLNSVVSISTKRA
jgi:ADP-glucose pyrophosphorylase